MKKKIVTLPRLIILFVIIIVAIMGAWLGLRSAIASGMTNWISDLEQEGYEVAHGGLAVTGFPFVVDARTENVSVRAPSSLDSDPSKNWAIKTDEIEFSSSTFTPLSWSGRHSGDMRVDMRGIDGERYMFDIAPAEIIADAKFGLNGSTKRLHADIGGTRINSLVGAEPPVLALAGARAELDIIGDEGHFIILAKDVILTEKYLGIVNTILGRELSRASIKGHVENWPMLEAGDTQAWMNSPARIKSEDWQMLWGRADIIGDFDIGFENGLPDGVIRFRVKNAQELIGKLAEVDLIPITLSVQLQAYVSGIDSDKDDRKLIEITMRNGVVKYGFFTLYEF